MVIVEKAARETGADAPRYVHSLALYMQNAKRLSIAEEYGMTLAHYIASDKKDDCKATDERVLATGGLASGTTVDWDAALSALHDRMSRRSTRSKKPARHLIASVHADESIDPDACAGIVTVLADELGCEAGLIMWALHGDTNNQHLHLLVLTLDEGGAATPFARDGRSYEAMQRAIARIEHDHSYTPEEGARYEVQNGRTERLLASSANRATKARAPMRTDVLRFETETGIESFTRYAQEMVAPQLELAESWDDAQKALALLCVQVIKAGSGGEIVSGDRMHKVKLSNIDRSLSWTKLVKRWGEWSELDTDPLPYEPRIRDPQRASQWAERDEAGSIFNDLVQARIARLKAERDIAIRKGRGVQSERRAELAGLTGEPRDIAKLKKSFDIICRRQADAIKDEYRDRMAALWEFRREFDEADQLDDLALDDVAAFDCSLSVAWAGLPAKPDALAGFTPISVGQAVQYWRDNVPSRRPAFVERGDHIWVEDKSDLSVRAALLIAQARYGVVAAHGDPAFVAQARRLGRELGIEVQVGAAPIAPAPRARSPRIQQRRDAVRRWQTTAVDERSKTPAASPVVADVGERSSASPEGPISVVSAHERRAFMARVARLLADEDWDPRDYRRARTTGGWRGRDGPREVGEPALRPLSTAVRQLPADAAMRGK